MSGSDKYDIYVIRSTKADILGFKENHAYYDLSQSEIITNAVEEMYPALADAAWNGEELLGIPWGIDEEVI